MKKTKPTIKLKTTKQVFARVDQSDTFQQEYRKELGRLRLAREIRELREKKRLTQATIAKQAGMPQSVIARIESGKHSFSLDSLQRIARVLNKEVRLV